MDVRPALPVLPADGRHQERAPPGPGHVDLLSAIRWQLFDRASSGSVLESGSTANDIARSWARSDPWLLGLAVASILPALLTRRLRAVTTALAIQIVILLRPGGYIPLPYVIGLMPFAALTLAATVGTIWRSGLLQWFQALRRQIPWVPMTWAQALVRATAATMVAAFVMTVALPTWSPALGDLMADDRAMPARQVLDWLETNVATHGSDGEPVRILVSDAMWVDLTELGYAVDWYFKVDLDPAVRANYPRGWREGGYVIFTNEMSEIAKTVGGPDMSTTLDARENGQLVAAFGSGNDRLWIYRVDGRPVSPGSVVDG